MHWLHGISGFRGTLACSAPLSLTHKGAMHGISCFWGSLAYRYFVHTNRCNGSSGTWGYYFKCSGSSHTLGYYLHWLTPADMSPKMPNRCKTTTNEKSKRPRAVINFSCLPKQNWTKVYCYFQNFESVRMNNNVGKDIFTVLHMDIRHVGMFSQQYYPMAAFLSFFLSFFVYLAKLTPPNFSHM